MREIIFESSGPRLVASSTGALKLVRTGSDSFHEHNNGPHRLGFMVCNPSWPENTPRLNLCLVTKPELFEFHRLPVEPGQEEEAIFGLNLTDGHSFIPSELPALTDPQTLKKLTHFHGNVAAALAYGNFAIRVRGAATVSALAQFHQEMLAGNVALLPDTWNIAGVSFVNIKELSPEEHELFEKDTQKAIISWFRTPVLNRNS